MLIGDCRLPAMRVLYMLHHMLRYMFHDLLQHILHYMLHYMSHYMLHYMSQWLFSQNVIQLQTHASKNPIVLY